MAIKEKIVTGKRFRRFVDGAWERISFWHKASDCEMNNGNNLEDEIQNIKNTQNRAIIYNETTDSYQGCISGQWRDIDYAGFNWDGYIVKDGIMNDKICGGLIVDDGGYNDFEIVKTEHFIRIKGSLKTDHRYTTLYNCTYRDFMMVDFLKPIDLTNYNEIRINSNIENERCLILIDCNCCNYDLGEYYNSYTHELFNMKDTIISSIVHGHTLKHGDINNNFYGESGQKEIIKHIKNTKENGNAEIYDISDINGKYYISYALPVYYSVQVIQDDNIYLITSSVPEVEICNIQLC